MRESAGQTFKSSLTHSYVIDTRNDRITATRGEYAKFQHEFAGLGGDASFYKTEVEGQISRPIANGVVRFKIFC
jgi:outer membrane protein insertion porin family